MITITMEMVTMDNHGNVGLDITGSSMRFQIMMINSKDIKTVRINGPSFNFVGASDSSSGEYQGSYGSMQFHLSLEIFSPSKKLTKNSIELLWIL
jgi:hypothetical protein